MSKEVTLPSGAVLKLNSAPFKVSKALYQAVLEECKEVKISFDTPIDVNLIKDLFCTGFSSKKIEDALGKCFERCLYNGQKITDETFEPENARQDYLQVCIEVAKENIDPFMKSLYAQYGDILKGITIGQA